MDNNKNKDSYSDENNKRNRNGAVSTYSSVTLVNNKKQQLK